MAAPLLRALSPDQRAAVSNAVRELVRLNRTYRRQRREQAAERKRIESEVARLAGIKKVTEVRIAGKSQQIEERIRIEAEKEANPAERDHGAFLLARVLCHLVLIVASIALIFGAAIGVMDFSGVVLWVLTGSPPDGLDGRQQELAAPFFQAVTFGFLAWFGAQLFRYAFRCSTHLRWKLRWFVILALFLVACQTLLPPDLAETEMYSLGGRITFEFKYIGDYFVDFIRNDPAKSAFVFCLVALIPALFRRRAFGKFIYYQFIARGRRWDKKRPDLVRVRTSMWRSMALIAGDQEQLEAKLRVGAVSNWTALWLERLTIINDAEQKLRAADLAGAPDLPEATIKAISRRLKALSAV